ncbi:response regulator [Methylobacterium iners]|nr:response regulator [Methylobacterium iners]
MTTDAVGRTTVLVVEDDSLVRLMTVEALTDEGYQVIEAATADEAHRLLEAHSDVQVLVTDVEMPGTLNGFALAHVARELSPSIGVIVFSARTFPSKGTLPVGARFLQKPVGPSALISLVHDLIAERTKGLPAEFTLDELADQPISSGISSVQITPVGS